LVQAAWRLIKSKKGGALKEGYGYMTGAKGVGKKKSIIGVARRLVELLWTLIRKGTDYEKRKFAGHSSVGDIVTEVLAS
jgi:hypothetical protein